MLLMEMLRAVPELWPMYGPWLVLHDPVGWREFVRLAAELDRPIVLDFSPLKQYLRRVVTRAHLKSFMETVGIKEAVEAVGVKEVLEAVGVKEALEAVGVKQILEGMTRTRSER